MSDDLTRDKVNEDGEEQGAAQGSTQGANDAEFGLMTFIVPGQEPMSLDELKAHHAQQAQDEAAAAADYDKMLAEEAEERRLQREADGGTIGGTINSPTGGPMEAPTEAEPVPEGEGPI